MKQVENARVTAISPLAKDIYLLTLYAPGIVGNSRTGQFVNLQVPRDGSRILRRPISISRVNRDAGTMDLVVQVLGGGTRRICDIEADERISIVGPQGNGFTRFTKAKSLWLVGGGVGIAPLFMAAEEYRIHNPNGRLSVFLGYATGEKAYYDHTFDTYADEVMIATEDGSLGHKGYVTPLMEKAIVEGQVPSLALACGPTPMLKAVQGIVNAKGIPCQLSLEERMACGIGACVGCVCRIGTPDTWEYKRVCSNGPVFDSQEVLFDE
jgi:dihydroorotate dehydrogenase electron transfer subunit